MAKNWKKIVLKVDAQHKLRSKWSRTIKSSEKNGQSEHSKGMTVSAMIIDGGEKATVPFFFYPYLAEDC